MYCPECLTEYRDGFVECADCHVPLKNGLPEPEPADHTGENLDVLIRTGFSDPLTIGLAKTLLEEAGIPFFEMNQNPTARQESGNMIGWLDIRVPRDREAEAREILQSVEALKTAPPPPEP